MLANTLELLQSAQQARRAVAAFNVYTIEGIRAAVNAAEETAQPIVLQAHPGALTHGRWALVVAMVQAAHDACVPVAVQLDHSTSISDMTQALQMGVSSVMADGSDLSFEDNVQFVRQAVELAASYGRAVEGELGKLSGTEDNLTVKDYEAKLTDPDQAAEFVEQSGAHCLAVCIGNVHGVYRTPPSLDFERLQAIRERVHVPLVLHGASGLPDDQIRRCVALGVCKFNVNTELRQAALTAMRHALQSPKADLTDVMNGAVHAMQSVARDKIQLFAARAD